MQQQGLSPSQAKENVHITPILEGFHWLPVEQRVIFKILLITYKVLNNLAPAYLSELVKQYVPSRNL